MASEGLKESFYIEDRQETYLHLLVFETLLEATLDADASRDLIIQTAENYWREARRDNFPSRSHFMSDFPRTRETTRTAAATQRLD